MDLDDLVPWLESDLGPHPADVLSVLLDRYQHRTVVTASDVVDDLLDIQNALTRWFLDDVDDEELE